MRHICVEIKGKYIEGKVVWTVSLAVGRGTHIEFSGYKSASAGLPFPRFESKGTETEIWFLRG